MGKRQTKLKPDAQTRRARAKASRLPNDKHLKALIEISSDSYYWEQDANLRFTRFIGAIFDKAGIDTRRFYGKTRWELGWLPSNDNGVWDKHMALLDAHQPFSDFIFRYTTSSGNVRFVNTSGQPVFDRRGRFKGYRGISRDVTRRVLIQRRLQIEREVAQTLAVASNVTDASDQIIQAMCRTLNWACGSYWELDDQNHTLHCVRTWGKTGPEIERFLTATRASSPLGVATEGLVRLACAKAEPVWHADVSTERSFRRINDARTAGLRGAFAFPIRAGTKIVGAIELFSRDMPSC